MIVLPAGLHGAHVRSVLEARVGPPTLRAALGEGVLVRYGRRVLVAREHALDFRTRCAAVLLAAGPHAVLARETALRLHGCTAAGIGTLHVQVPYWAGAGRQAGVRVHHGRVDEVCEVAGLRCQPVAAALVDVLCRGDRYVALACTDEVLAELPAAGRAELKAAVRVAITGRPDPRGTRRALALLGLATGKSPGRSRLLLTVVDAGLPAPEQHYPAPTGPADLAWPAAELALDYAPEQGRLAVRESGRWTLLRAGPADLRIPTALVARLTRCLHARLVPGRPGGGHH